MEDHFTREELMAILERPSIPIRDRALIAFLFVTAARIGEVVKEIKKNQLRYETRDGKNLLIVYSVPIEKRRREIVRNIPISVEKEQFFLNIIDTYLKLLTPDELLFDINRTRAFQITQKWTGKGCHFLRHSRLTNLRVEYRMPVDELSKITGWDDWRSAQPYDHLDMTTVIERL